MIGGIVSSNQRVVPFKKLATNSGVPDFIQPGSTNAGTTISPIANLNGVL